jgi:tetratricopeptide (TPR) repeat protein
VGANEYALNDFNKALELEPNSYNALFNRARTLVISGEFDETLPDLDKLIEIDPENAWLYFLRGVTYSELGEQAKAMLDLEMAAQLDASLAPLVEEARLELGLD